MEFVMKEMWYFTTGDYAVPELQIEMRDKMFLDWSTSQKVHGMRETKMFLHRRFKGNISRRHID